MSEGNTTSTATIRTLLIDDEPPARRALRAMLEEEPDIEIVGEASSVEEGVALIERLEPDLVFLDVQLPERDGFALFQDVPPENVPVIVFVTAFDQYAIKAFGVRALDYLMKPVDEDRLQETLQRVRQQLAPAAEDGSSAPVTATDVDSARQVLQLLERAGVARRYLERIAVREKERVILVRVRDVDRFEASGKFVTLHVGKRTFQIRDTMGRLERALDPAQFVRVSRFAIVNVERIVELRPWFHGDYVLILADGVRVTSTQGYREAVNGLLER